MFLSSIAFHGRFIGPTSRPSDRIIKASDFNDSAEFLGRPSA